MSKIDPCIFVYILIYIALHIATYYFVYFAYSAYCNMCNMLKIDPCIFFYLLIYILCIYIYIRNIIGLCFILWALDELMMK